MDQFSNPNNFGAPNVSYTPMQLPESLFGTTAPGGPGLVQPYTPLQLPEIPTTAPPSYTHMADGSWADAQVTLSDAATAPPPASTTGTAPAGTAPAAGSPEEQAQIEMLTQMYAQSMEMENMMFQQQMMQMQMRAAMQQQQALAARRNMSSSLDNTKLTTGPELRMDFGDDGGDYGGEE